MSDFVLSSTAPISVEDSEDNFYGTIIEYVEVSGTLQPDDSITVDVPSVPPFNFQEGILISAPEISDYSVFSIVGGNKNLLTAQNGGDADGGFYSYSYPTNQPVGFQIVIPSSTISLPLVVLINLENIDGPDSGYPSQELVDLESVMVDGNAGLFTDGDDTIDFNNLTANQITAIDTGAELYNTLAGNDTVTLPNQANYQLTSTVAWDPTQTFYTGDGNDMVAGGNGNYNIALGGGTDTVEINGDGNSNITAGDGTDTITINGNGDDNVVGGSGPDNITLGGTGNDSVTFDNSQSTVSLTTPTATAASLSNMQPGDDIRFDADYTIDQMLFDTAGQSTIIQIFDPNQSQNEPSAQITVEGEINAADFNVADQSSSELSIADSNQTNASTIFDGIDTQVFDVQSFVDAANTQLEQWCSEYLNAKLEELPKLTIVSIIAFLNNPTEFGYSAGREIAQLLKDPLQYIKGLLSIEPEENILEFGADFANATLTLGESYIQNGTISTSDITAWDLAVAKGMADLLPFGSSISAIGSDFVTALIDEYFDYEDAVSGNSLIETDYDGTRRVSNFDIQNQLYNNTVYTYAPSGALEEISFNDVAGEPYSSYQYAYVDGAYSGVTFDYTGIIGAPYSSYDYVYSANGNFIGSKFDYTAVPRGANFSGYEYDYDGGGHVTQVDFSGVTGASYSSYEYDYVGGVFAGSKFGVTAVPQAAAYSSYEIDYDAANAFAGDKFFIANVTDASYTTEEVDFDASDDLVEVLFGDFSTTPYSSLELSYSAGVYAGYKAFYTGITGQSYTGVEVDVSVANQITKTVYTGLNNTPYSSVEEDFSGEALISTAYDFTNPPSGQTFYAYQAIDDANGNPLREIVDNNDGSHTIVGFQPNETFTSIGDDTITGGGANETFVFAPVYGHDTITDFASHLTGVGHDTISVSTSEFANFAALLADSQNLGGNVLITAQNGDTITLANLSTSALAADQGDFAFHS